MKILDSDHCIAILRGKLDLHDRVNPEEELAITTINIGELTHGAHRSKNSAENLARLDVLLAALIVFSYDELCAYRFGFLKANLESIGKPLHDLDLQIASIAVEHNIPLVTHNHRHFERIDGLVLEDWLA